MRKFFLFLSLLFLFRFHLYSETNKAEKDPSPHVFHNIGWNFLNSAAYNYGFNFIGAGLGTWGMIATGLDWQWRNTVYDSAWLQHIGSPVMSAGGIIPILTPLVFLIPGKIQKNEKLVITASALTQTLILTMAYQSPLKMITGRRDPGLVNNRYYERIEGEPDFSGVFNWFNMDFFNGWPSGHTANAFSAAATISEIYHDNIWIKLGVFTYAALIGFGTTVHAHWASEAVAGALIGYAIGKTVGKSYRKFLDKDEDKNKVSFYLTPRSAGVNIRL